jgi:predicted RNase H-like HicB family nuclease
MHDYIALIHKDADSDFGVSFPDFPGLISAGTTLDEARDMAAEALALHIDGLLEDGEALPEPSSLERVMAEAENRDAVAALVPLPPIRSARVNVMLPGDVLVRIDRYAKAHGLTRSGFLAMAAKRAIEENVHDAEWQERLSDLTSQLTGPSRLPSKEHSS